LISAYHELEEENLDQKSPSPPGWGLMQQARPCSSKKRELLKSPLKIIGWNNLQQHKLRKRTIRLGMLNVQGIRNKTGDIIKGLKELKQDITILTETKKKGNRAETLGPYIHFYSGVSKEKRAKRGVSILVKKRYKRYITTWETINENMIQLHMNLFGKKLCILGIYAISEDESTLVKEDFLGKLNEVIDETGNSREILMAGDFNNRTRRKINNQVVGPIGEEVIMITVIN
jgi:hypothetical protein